MTFARPRSAVRSTSLGRGCQHARRECSRGRAHHPARQVDRPSSADACAVPWSGVTTRAGCTTGRLRPWNRSGNPRHRRRRTDPDARAATPGQAEAVITSRGGLGTPRWRSASAWAWPTVAATPEVPRSHICRTRSGPRWCTSWLAEGGFRRGSARRRPSSIHCGIMLSSASAAMHSWAAALAPGSSSLRSTSGPLSPARTGLRLSCSSTTRHRRPGRRGDSRPGPRRCRRQPALDARVADSGGESPLCRARAVDGPLRVPDRQQAGQRVRLVRG